MTESRAGAGVGRLVAAARQHSSNATAASDVLAANAANRPRKDSEVTRSLLQRFAPRAKENSVKGSINSASVSLFKDTASHAPPRHSFSTSNVTSTVTVATKQAPVVERGDAESAAEPPSSVNSRTHTLQSGVDINSQGFKMAASNAFENTARLFQLEPNYCETNQKTDVAGAQSKMTGLHAAQAHREKSFEIMNAVQESDEPEGESTNARPLAQVKPLSAFARAYNSMHLNQSDSSSTRYSSSDPVQPFGADENIEEEQQVIELRKGQEGNRSPVQVAAPLSNNVKMSMPREVNMQDIVDFLVKAEKREAILKTAVRQEKAHREETNHYLHAMQDDNKREREKLDSVTTAAQHTMEKCSRVMEEWAGQKCGYDTVVQGILGELHKYKCLKDEYRKTVEDEAVGIRALERQIETYRGKVKELYACVDTLSEEHRRLEKVADDNAKLRSSGRQLQDESRQIKTQMAVAQAKSDENEKQLEEEKQAKASLQKDLETARVKITEHEKSLVATQVEIDSLQSQLQACKKENERTMSQAKEQTEHIAERLDAMVRKQDSASPALDSLVRELDVWKKENAGITEKLLEAEKMVANLEEKKRSMQESLEKLEVKCGESEEISRAKSIETARLEVEVQSLKTQAEKDSKRAEESQGRIRFLEIEILNCKGDSEKLRDAEKKLLRNCDELRQENGRLRGAQQVDYEKLGQLGKNLESAMHREQGAIDKLSLREKEIDSLRKERDSERERASKLDSEQCKGAAQASEHVKHLKGEIAKAKSAQRQAESKAAQSNDETENLRAELEQLKAAKASSTVALPAQESGRPKHKSHAPPIPVGEDEEDIDATTADEGPVRISGSLDTATREKMNPKRGAKTQSHSEDALHLAKKRARRAVGRSEVPPPLPAEISEPNPADGKK